MMNIAFLGPEGSYSHIASLRYANYYCKQIIEYSCRNFKEIINSVENCQAEYGILPIENSNSGLIDEVCNLLLNTELILIEDITIPIQHRILVYNNTDLKHIQTLYSHPQPAQQCSKFLKNFKEWKIILCNSSAIAIRIVANLKQSNSAALGSTQGGIFYGLQPLLSQSISNHYINTTRFIILKKNTNNKPLILHNTFPRKIMLVISIEYNLTTLHLILKVLKFYNIKINFLRSYQLIQFYKYLIIIEIVAHVNNFFTQQALIKIRKISHSLKILGCYPSI